MFEQRRGTLAPISDAQLNSRLSLLPQNNNRASIISKTPKSILKMGGKQQDNNMMGSRPSIAPTNFNRNNPQKNTSLNTSLNNSIMNVSMNNGSMNTSVMNTSGHLNKKDNTGSIIANDADSGKRAARELVRFLSQAGFPHEMSVKKLNSGSSTDFVNVFDFLLQHLDSSVQFRLPTPNQMKRLEAEEAKNRRRTTFQTTQSLTAFQKDHKTSVHGFDEQLFVDIVTLFKHPSPPGDKFLKSSAFTPRGFNKMLLYMGWFLDVIKYHGNRLKAREDELSSDDEFMFFTYLRQRYMCFLQNDENGMEQVINQWRSQAEQTSAETRNGNNEMQRRLDEMRRMIEQITMFLSERNILEQQRSDYSRDIQLVQNNIEQLQREVTEIDTHINAQQIELGHIQRQISMLSRERDSLKSQIDKQELKPQDVLRMNKQKSALEDDLRRVQQERDCRNQELFNLENEIRGCSDQMMKLVNEYNQLATVLPVVTEEEPDDDGDMNMNMDMDTGFELRIKQERVQDEMREIEQMEMESSQPTESSSQDVTQVVSYYPKANYSPLVFSTNIDLYEAEHKIRRMKDDLIKETRKLHDDFYELKEKHDMIEDSCQKEEENIRELDRQLEREKIHLSSNKQDWDKEIQQIYFEIDDVEDEIKKTKNENQILTSTLSETERQMQQLLREQKMLEEQQRLELEEMGKLLVRAAQAVYEHKEHVQSTLTQAANYRSTVIQNVHEE